MIAGIESASTDISLAVARPDGSLLAGAGWTSDRRQGHETLPRLLGLLQEIGEPLSGVRAVTVGVGPGSFTGLRVGMSLAKGLALALRVPIVGLPSLGAWLDAEPDAVAALGRAGARESYLQFRGEAEPRIVAHDELPPAVNDHPLVAPAELAAALGLGAARPPYAAAAALVAAAARHLAESPAGDDLARLEPTYLRAPRGLGQLPHAEAG